MRTIEPITTLKSELQNLTEKVMSTRNSLNKSVICYQQNVCPFCNAAREEQLLGGFTSYKQCTCEENQKALAKWADLLKQERDLTDSMELIKAKLRHHEQAAQKLLEESNLGRRFQSRTFENFHSTEFAAEYEIALNYAKNFVSNAESEGQGLLFIGTPGTGKTHLAAAIANYIIAKLGLQVKFGGFIDILDSIKQSFQTDDDVITELSDVPLLVIDDLGKERATEWSNSILYQVLNRRYENYLPVIITTNQDLRTLERRIGDATLSRLIEMCSGIRMVGRDYRKKRLA